MSEEFETVSDDEMERIAVIGLAGRFPKAKNLSEFWHNLRNGVDQISRFSDEELKALGVPDEVINHPKYVKAGTSIDGMDMFDAMFFDFNPREAELIDPQQRLFLECAWEALESAGYNPETYGEPIGVYAGSSPNEYIRMLPNDLKASDVTSSFQRLISNENDFLATRVSHNFNLKGPSLTVQTACSTSMVAVHLACQALLHYQCSIALAGGVCLIPKQKGGYFYQEGMILSPDGFCRAFDTKAQGTVLGQGAGVVVLKRLSEAIADGDTIDAVIRGTAINNDGSSKVSYTAPSVDGQVEVISMAHALSDVSADSISYIEAHGTGTSLGDPIEIAALSQAFSMSTDKKEYCAIGSIKTNIGHLDAAAGVAGLIKTILSLKHKEIPPSLNFDEPNPKIEFKNSPFYVNNKLVDWKKNGTPRRAGVSSFGIGGTNAHTILEEAPEMEPSGESRSSQLIVLSAKSATALDDISSNLIEDLKKSSDANLADIAFTLQAGRKSFMHRRILVAENIDDVVTSIEKMDPNRVISGTSESSSREIVFMFPGQGSQYVNMGLDLYQSEPVFREHIDHCSEILKTHIGTDLRDVLYPKNAESKDAAEKLKNTLITQPALFAIEYALAKLWMSWGILPNTLVGHSIGEYVTACLAGVFSVEDALLLVASRGRLIQELPGGSMLAVSLSQADVKPYLDENISLAVVNSPVVSVVSGSPEAIKGLEEKLKKQNVVSRHLHTSHAFHSIMMEPILERFTEIVKGVSLKTPQLPIVSTVTGKWVSEDDLTNPSYWTNNLRHTVRFADAVAELLKKPDGILLEVGPGQTLSTLVRQQASQSKDLIVLSSMRHPQQVKSDVAVILNALGRLWLSGIEIDWSGYYENEKRNRVRLPTYPFERQRYWIAQDEQPRLNGTPKAETPKKEDSSPKIEKLSSDIVASSVSLPEVKDHIDNWIYLPTWKRSFVPPLASSDQGTELMVMAFVNEDCTLSSALLKSLEEEGHKILKVKIGPKFQTHSADSFSINPTDDKDYDSLFSELQTNQKLPKTILHLWTLSGNQKSCGLDKIDGAIDLGLHSLLSLARSLGKQDSKTKFRIEVISNGIHEVTGEETLIPESAIAIGPCKVIPLEYANISCQHIDAEYPKSDSLEEKRTIKQLITEITSDSSEVVVAYRASHRWIESVEPVQLNDENAKTKRVRDGGTYLILGGTGGIGLELAKHLAKSVSAKLILVGRSEFPSKEKWDDWTRDNGAADATSQKIEKIKEIESLGSEVFATKADVTDIEEMKKVLDQGKEKFGQVNGVIHAAGVIDSAGAILTRSKEATDESISSKVKGTLVIDQLLKDVKLDFFVLYSSIASVLYHDRFGQVGYASANSFIETFSYYKSARDATFTATINSDDWEIVGMSVRAKKTISETYGSSENIFDPLNSFLPSDGITLFSRIISSDFLRVLISTRDLRIRIAQDEFAVSPFLQAAANAKVTKATHPRPNLGTEYVAPGNSTEETIAGIWQEILGFDRVGIHDNFFELGGDSLLVTLILPRLNEAFPVEFPMTSLFEHSTVEALSKLVPDGYVGESPSQASEIQENNRIGKKIIEGEI